MSCLKKLCCFSLILKKSSNQTQETSNQIQELSQFDDKTHIFTLEGLETPAKCTKCYDADTVHLVIPYSNNYYRWTCRLAEIDSAEIKSQDKAESDFAKKSRDYLKSLILDKIVTVKCGKFDKYGRLLVNIYLDQLDINKHLLDKGYAYKYLGATKKKFSDWASIEV